MCLEVMKENSNVLLLQVKRDLLPVSWVVHYEMLWRYDSASCVREGLPVQNCIRFQDLHCSDVGTLRWTSLRRFEGERALLCCGFLAVSVRAYRMAWHIENVEIEMMELKKTPLLTAPPSKTEIFTPKTVIK